jgi:ubiquinone biosynthesis protein UbiJ
MLDKIKDMAISQGMKLMSDPRFMKLMSDPRVTNAMMQAFELQAKISEKIAETSKMLADRLHLASQTDVKELKDEVLNLRERLDAVERK